MIDTNKGMANKHGYVEAIQDYGKIRDGETAYVRKGLGGLSIQYEIDSDGKAAPELGPDFDVFNVLTQKEKAIKELDDYLSNIPAQGPAVNFPETFKALRESES